MIACGDERAPASGSEDEIRTASGAPEGATCGDGFFGAPDVRCADGLECTYLDGTKPAGPDGSSSAATGTCQKPAGAPEGATCGDGFFGTPNVACADGLVCAYPDSTAPTGPDGSSSAATGTCQKPGAPEGAACGDGYFGSPDVACADGLVCRNLDGSVSSGPSGAASAATGTCQKP